MKKIIRIDCPFVIEDLGLNAPLCPVIGHVLGQIESTEGNYGQAGDDKDYKNVIDHALPGDRFGRPRARRAGLNGPAPFYGGVDKAGNKGKREQESIFKMYGPSEVCEIKGQKPQGTRSQGIGDRKPQANAVFKFILKAYCIDDITGNKDGRDEVTILEEGDHGALYSPRAGSIAKDCTGVPCSSFTSVLMP